MANLLLFTCRSRYVWVWRVWHTDIFSFSSRWQNLLPLFPLRYKTQKTQQIRRYIVGAVLRDITFSGASYNSFIDLQEKLHGTLARKRTLVSVGTHDLDKMDASKGVFYDAVKPEDVPKFEPLRGEGKEMDGHGIMQHFEVNRKSLWKPQDRTLSDCLAPFVCRSRTATLANTSTLFAILPSTPLCSTRNDGSAPCPQLSTRK